MKTSIVTADGTFATNTAPLLGDWETVAAQAEEIGFDAMQLTISQASQVDVEALQKACERHHLAVSGLATGRAFSADGLCISSPDPQNRQQAVKRLLDCVELSRQLGGGPRVIIGAIRGWAKNCGGPERFLELSRASIQPVLEQAAAQGVQVLYEAIDYLESEMHRDVAETVEFINSFHCPNFLLQLDSMHLLNEGEDSVQAVERGIGCLGQVDISDAERTPPDGLRFDFPRLMTALKAKNYQDYLVFEYSPGYLGAKSGFDYIQSLLK